MKMDELSADTYKRYHEKLLSERFKISFEDASDLYDITKSFRNSMVNRTGKTFESVIAEVLNDNGVSFVEQVSVDLATNCFRKGSNEPVVDFVIKRNSVDDPIGKPISDYIIVSCKYTCRERYKQDDWTYAHEPMKYILLVGTDDYPKKFIDTDKRVLLTLVPKRNDERKTADMLLNEVAYNTLLSTGQ